MEFWNSTCNFIHYQTKEQLPHCHISISHAQYIWPVEVIRTISTRSLQTRSAWLTFCVTTFLHVLADRSTAPFPSQSFVSRASLASFRNTKKVLILHQLWSAGNSQRALTVCDGTKWEMSFGDGCERMCLKADYTHVWKLKTVYSCIIYSAQQGCKGEYNTSIDDTCHS